MKKPMKMVKKSPAKNLTAKQKKMDVNKNNRIDGSDLASLRKGSGVAMKKASMAKMKKMKTSAATMKKAAMKLKKDSAMMMKKAAMKMKKVSAMKMKMKTPSKMSHKSKK